MQKFSHLDSAKKSFLFCQKELKTFTTALRPHEFLFIELTHMYIHEHSDD